MCFASIGNGGLHLRFLHTRFLHDLEACGIGFECACVDLGEAFFKEIEDPRTQSLRGISLIFMARMDGVSDLHAVVGDFDLVKKSDQFFVDKNPRCMSVFIFRQFFQM